MDILKWSDYTNARQNAPKPKGINEVLNKPLVIVGVEFEDGENGRIGVIHTENEGDIRTGSKVLLKQMDEMKKILDSGKVKKISATIVQEKSGKTKWSYYTFR
jgi:hypothetical protein